MKGFNMQNKIEEFIHVSYVMHDKRGVYGKYETASIYSLLSNTRYNIHLHILTDETYNYLSGGDVPQTEVHFEGVAVKMDKELAGLEGAFRDQLEYMGYTESEVNEMLTSYSDGECLVLSGQAEMSTMYVMTAIVFAVLLLAILLIVRNYRREAEYDKQ